MITTIRLVNVHHFTRLQLFVFCMVRTSKIYSLSDFAIYSTALFSVVPMPLATFTPFLPPQLPASGNQQCVLRVCK